MTVIKAAHGASSISKWYKKFEYPEEGEVEHQKKNEPIGYIYDEMRRLREKHPDTPLYAVVTDICASGGYYIASAADKIYADKASIVGSIGVRMDNFGFVEAIDKLGVERRTLTAGENKALLDPFLPENTPAIYRLR